MSSKSIYHYTYRITNVVEQKHYYGAHTSKDGIIPSEDIGKRYFSNSWDTRFIRDQQENPDHYRYKVIVISETRKRAFELEIKLHTKFQVDENPSFYNRRCETEVSDDILWLHEKDEKRKELRRLKEERKRLRELENERSRNSEWTLEQKAKMLKSIEFLSSEEFPKHYPYLYAALGERKTHLLKMMLHFTDLVSDRLQHDGKPLFYGSYPTLMNICEIGPKNRSIMSQSLSLFSLLNILIKMDAENIPEAELKKAREIAKKHGHKKLTGFYQFKECGIETLEDSEICAKVLVDHNMTLRGLSREYVLRTFGRDLADKVFPQYKSENLRGNSKSSDEKTLKLSQKLLETIESKGFAFEKDIKGTGSNETQWKKSIQEVLDSYGLKRIRLNKDLKQSMGLMDQSGYPFIILKDQITPA